MANSHVIGKQLWELQLSSSEDAYAIQQQISEMVWKALVPELNVMFDRMAGEDEVVILDRVVIDIGTIGSKAMDTGEIVNRILHDLEDRCFTACFLPQSRKDNKDWRIKDNNSFSLGKHYFDLWLHWLKYGALPPYTTKPDDSWIQQVLETLATAYQATELLEDTLEMNPQALKRLILQHSSQDLKSLTELYTGHRQTKLLEALEDLKRLSAETSVASLGSYRNLEINFWTDVLGKVILGHQKAESKSLLQQLRMLPNLYSAHEQGLVQGRDYPFLNELLEETRARPEPKEQASDRDKKGPAEPAMDKQQLDAKEEVEVQTLHFFGNAGMVLLHPFLNQLFGNLQLVEAGIFNDFECQSKGVVLLHFMATGREQVREFELSLPKFLCGMPANRPMDHTLVLSEKEKKEANNLLEVVITHWGALGKTSPEGLREGFLMRDGKLEQEQGGWKLHVEQKAMDVLLDRLPWTLSMLKLPWMKEILKVEWR